MAGGFKRGGARGGKLSKKRTSPDDDNDDGAATQPSKRAKGDKETTPLVPKLQKDEEGNEYVGLKSNDLRRVTIGDFKGSTLISIREYYLTSDEEIKPGKKGISLTLDQYNAFVTALPLIESVLKKKGDTTVRPSYDGEGPAVAADEGGEETDGGEAAKQDEDDEEGSSA